VSLWYHTAAEGLKRLMPSICITGQMWSENDVLASKRKPVEETEPEDDRMYNLLIFYTL